MMPLGDIWVLIFIFEPLKVTETGEKPKVKSL